jgi:hypothetical protein
MKRLMIGAAVFAWAMGISGAADAQSTGTTRPPDRVGPAFVDANADGVCDNCTGTPPGQRQKARNGKGGYGAGNGTGHQRVGPRDGSGYGRGGGGNCTGTGPRGQGQRRQR